MPQGQALCGAGASFHTLLCQAAFCKHLHLLRVLNSSMQLLPNPHQTCRPMRRDARPPSYRDPPFLRVQAM